LGTKGYRVHHPAPNVETIPLGKSVDELVEQLLLDQDFLLSKEIKHKVEELNQLFVKANSQKLKVEVACSQFDTAQECSMAHIEVKLFKQI